MPGQTVSRRNFFAATAAGSVAAAAVADPARAAAQAVGVKPGDLPDLTVKQVKVYVLKAEPPRAGRPPACPRAASSSPRW